MSAVFWVSIHGIFRENIIFFKRNSYFLFRDEKRKNEKEKDFQKIIPDYLGSNENGETIVADAKYIRMEDYRNFTADRAMPIYYKTLMYMLRFKAKTGFLFYPSRSEDNFHPLEIIDTECKLTLLGLQIPEYKNGTTYAEFCKNMKESEIKFKEKIADLLNK